MPASANNECSIGSVVTRLKPVHVHDIVCMALGPCSNSSGLLRQPQLMTVQRLVKCLYLALIANYCQLQDHEYHYISSARDHIHIVCRDYTLSFSLYTDYGQLIIGSVQR